MGANDEHPYDNVETVAGVNWTPPFAVPKEQCPEASVDLRAACIAADVKRRAEQFKHDNPFNGHCRPDTTIHPARPTQLETKLRCDHVVTVTWRWSEALGREKGYTLYRDKFGPLDTPDLSPAVTLALADHGTLVVSRADRITVDWMVYWKFDRGAQIVLWIFDNARDHDYDWRADDNHYPMEGEMAKKAAEEKVNEMHAEAVTTREPSEYDTFDKPADETPVLPWGDDNHKRGVFYGRYENEVWRPRACPKDRAEAIRKAVLVREYGVDSLRSFNGDVDELLGKLKSAVEVEYPLAMAFFDQDDKPQDPHKPPVGMNPDKLYWRVKFDYANGSGKTCVKARCAAQAVLEAGRIANVKDFKAYDLDPWEDDGTLDIRKDADGSYWISASLDDNSTSSPVDSKNGQSEPEPQRSADMPEPTKTERSSDTKTTNVEPPANNNEPIIDKAQFRKERMIKVSGQDYLKAGDRVIIFRADHPDWTLETVAIQLLPDFAVFKAMIKDASGKLLSTGHGFCTPELAKKVSGRFVEKAETAAIARALSLLGGYGTDDSLDDSDYLSDSPVAKAA